MTTPFVPGLTLAGEYDTQVVRPLLDAACPGLPHSAALLGAGSEVLGFDSGRSTDHDWGPRSQIFLADGEARRHAARIEAALTRDLLATFRGYPTAFPRSHEPGGRARTGVEVTMLHGWLTARLAFDPRAGVGPWRTGWPPLRSGWPRSRPGGCSTTAPARSWAGPGPSQRVPGRRLAVRAGLPVAPHRRGGSLPWPVRRGLRRTGLGGAHRAAGPRPDAAGPADGPLLPALQQVARHRLRPDARGGPAGGGAGRRRHRRWTGLLPGRRTWAGPTGRPPPGTTTSA